MKTDLNVLLYDQLIALADDELILGHRDSEWCGHAPILEEDIAFANLALDEIGHAKTWYDLAASLVGENSALFPDRIVFTRTASDFRNIQMVELPNGDWAFSILRQYLFDTAETVRLAELVKSSHSLLAEASAKIQKEELYHYRHTHAWVKRLGSGTEESHRRMQKAIDELWPYVEQMWQPLPEESLLVTAGYLAPSLYLERTWLDKVIPVLRACELNIPERSEVQPALSRLSHTFHLEVLVAEMQSLVHLEPQAEW
jgi:ring-1,2-phenylacetyl-CoA epoxidase subunit PaaC